MTEKIANEIDAEQRRGREKYGGHPDNRVHDAKNPPEFWPRWIINYANHLATVRSTGGKRQALLAIAGLATSAIEAMDRAVEMADKQHISGCAFDAAFPHESGGSCMPDCPIGGEDTRRRNASGASNYPLNRVPAVGENQPLKPGYYWAKWIVPSKGTHEGGLICPMEDWEIVQVNANHLYWAENPAEEDALSVSVPGVREVQWRSGFVWGHFVCPLEKGVR